MNRLIIRCPSGKYKSLGIDRRSGNGLCEFTARIGEVSGRRPHQLRIDVIHVKLVYGTDRRRFSRNLLCFDPVPDLDRGIRLVLTGFTKFHLAQVHENRFSAVGIRLAESFRLLAVQSVLSGCLRCRTIQPFLRGSFLRQFLRSLFRCRLLRRSREHRNKHETVSGSFYRDIQTSARCLDRFGTQTAGTCDLGDPEGCELIIRDG